MSGTHTFHPRLCDVFIGVSSPQSGKEEKKNKPHHANKPTQTNTRYRTPQGRGWQATRTSSLRFAPPLAPSATPHFWGFPPSGIGMTTQTCISSCFFLKTTYASPNLQHNALNPTYFPPLLVPTNPPWQDQALQPGSSCPELLYGLLPPFPSQAPRHAKRSPHPKLGGNSHVLLGGRGKSLDLGQSRVGTVSSPEAF